ncbi:DUF1700 domain-containing protein [Levilactobacillus zymae]|uniref:Integral membrane protein (Putative) n=1 Tax=Levilactobacillus zymae TaxID=267363 RepID=A0A1Y6JY36_9LACO|nr:DUF1700 domain-containing protein [Levilactobacillus zymae]SMS13244.1 integral membrane protein (putative) [Levilactobacillus zymae]
MTEYIQALQKLLLQLTAAEQQDVVEYYREYLQEADITTYEAAVAELGTPQTVARKVLADYSIKMTEQPAGRQSTPAGTKANVKMIWLVILALLSTPVTIPLILVVGALVVAAGSVAFAGVMTVLALLVAGFAGGIVGVIVGLMTLLTAPWTGLFYLGLGLIALGVSWLVTVVVVRLVQWLIQVIAEVAKWAYRRWVTDRKDKRGDQA